VFLMILNPLSAQNSGENMHLLRAESPGIKITKLVPRMKDNASILYLIYIVLTVLEFLFLVCGRVPVFDSVTLAFGTAGTGGFAIRNDSLMSYSAYAQWVVTAFMFLFSFNFGLYFLLLIRRWKTVVRNEELRVFLQHRRIGGRDPAHPHALPDFASFGEALRAVVFQVMTVLSTSGFATVDFDRWPQFARAR
jgi:trk system potassium uptake protein TrkH